MKFIVPSPFTLVNYPTLCKHNQEACEAEARLGAGVVLADKCLYKIGWLFEDQLTIVEKPLRSPGPGSIAHHCPTEQ